MSAIIVYMTAKDKEEAKSISKALLFKKLIACANIFEGVTSIYEWNGEVCEEGEAAAIFKTKESLFQKLKEEVLKLHSYENPALIAIKADNGSEQFLSWIERQTLHED